MTTARVLLATGLDGLDLRVAQDLRDQRLHVRSCDDLSRLPHMIRMHRPDLVAMRVPDSGPDDVAAMVRRMHGSLRPLLLCVVEGGAAQRVAALRAGADACIDRPAGFEELSEHVLALLRRAPWLQHVVHQVGELVVDESSHVALFADGVLRLSPKEFDLLAMLARHPGSIVTKPAMLEAVWGFDAYDVNLVEVHVSSLRRRIPPDARKMIQTVRGLGYVLRDEVAQEQPA